MLWAVVLAVGLALTGLVWRHLIGQSPFPNLPMRDWLFEKWRLGPLRILNLFAMMALVLHFGP